MASSQQAEGNPLAPEKASAIPLKPDANEDNDSEWEYEYSTTETETYYVTLDLSTTDFTARKTKTIHHGGRGGFMGRPTPIRYSQKGKGEDRDSDSEGGVEAANGNSDDDKQQQTGQHESQAAGRRKSQAADVDEDEMGDVQILDLHSTNPIISYKGRVYSAQWAENIGTELLFTKRDNAQPLPALRHLEKDLDLLAASCARIIVNEKQLVPKTERSQQVSAKRSVGAEDNDDDEDGEDKDPEDAVVPPPERRAPQERIEQGNFLAKLIALKRQRGEKDEVTVIARKPETKGTREDSGWGGDRRGNTRGANKPRGGRRATGPKARGRGRPPAGSERQSVRFEDDSDEDNEAEAGQAGSVPTPQTWKDLTEDTTMMDEEAANDDGEGDHMEIDDE